MLDYLSSRSSKYPLRNVTNWSVFLTLLRRGHWTPNSLSLWPIPLIYKYFSFRFHLRIAVMKEVNNLQDGCCIYLFLMRGRLSLFHSGKVLHGFWQGNNRPNSFCHLFWLIFTGFQLLWNKAGFSYRHMFIIVRICSS